MSHRAAKTASEAVGHAPPEYITVHSSDGELVVLRLEKDSGHVVAMLRPGANMGFALVVLRRLASQLVEALMEG